MCVFDLVITYLEGSSRCDCKYWAMLARREPFFAFDARLVRSFGVEVLEAKMEV